MSRPEVGRSEPGCLSMLGVLAAVLLAIGWYWYVEDAANGCRAKGGIPTEIHRLPSCEHLPTNTEEP